jgi:hypothetical protein
MFHQRNFGLHPDHTIEEITRTFPTNQQLVGLLTLVAIGGSAVGFGATLALKWLGQTTWFQRFKKQLVTWFEDAGGRQVYWYTQPLERTVLDLLQPITEAQALEYNRDAGQTAAEAAWQDAVIDQQRSILLFVVEKAKGEPPFVKHVKSGWLSHQDQGDLFTVCNEQGQALLSFPRRNLANLFHIGHRPCLAVRIYPEATSQATDD